MATRWAVGWPPCYRAFRILSVAALLTATSAPSPANDLPYGPPPPYDATAPWCVSEGSADGVIVRMGPYYFRLCRAPDEQHSARIIRVTINPARVPGLKFNDSLVGLTFDDRISFEKMMMTATRFLRPSGKVDIGGALYEMYESIGRAPSGEPGIVTYIYQPESDNWDRDLPAHHITCYGVFGPAYGDNPVSCYIKVWRDGVWADLLIMGDGFLRPMPADLFPEFTLDMVRVMEAADVTGEIETLRGKVTVYD